MNEKPEVAKVGLHELKPCPFCGGEAGLSLVGTSYMAHCYTPNCIMEVTPYFASVENAVDAWNKRADDWTLPAMEPPRKREITINAQVNGKEVWRKALFAPKPTNAEKRAYGGYSIKVSNEPCYHLSGVVMSDNPDSVSFYDRDGDEILRVNSNFLVSILRVDKGEALMEFMPHEATVNAGGDNGQWEGE